jgi:pilus assembly protein CpaF
VRDQVAGALDVVVHQARLPDGSRVVESVTEVVRAAGGIGTRELYRRGGELRPPADGALAARIDALRGGGARVELAQQAGLDLELGGVAEGSEAADEPPDLVPPDACRRSEDAA